MQNTTPVMDRAEMERIVYQAIGHQFRLPSLFAMLLLVVGFVLGHYVAARHTGEIADRFEQRITTLQEKVAALESTSGGSFSRGPLTSSPATSAPGDLAVQDSNDASPFDSEASNFRLAGMATTFDAATSEFTMLSQSILADVEVSATATRTVIDDLRSAAEIERDACLAELQPYVDRKLSVPASMVVQVIQTIYADQDRRLAAAIDDAAAKATGLDPRDTSVKIFPPMAEGEASVPSSQIPAESTDPVGHRYFPKPSAPRSLFFSPVGAARAPAPATSAIDTGAVLR